MKTNHPNNEISRHLQLALGVVPIVHVLMVQITLHVVVLTVFLV